jgi:hypothetical protein
MPKKIKPMLMEITKVLLSTARIWGFISMLFLLFMLLANIFGEENMNFTNRKEWFTFILFPMGIIFGLFVAYRSAITGGIICFISILISCILLPELTKSFYYVFSVFPGILFLIYGINKLKINSK